MSDTELPFPRCDLSNPAELDAWFGRSQLWAHVRKIVLAKCRQLERAKCEVANEKYTVDKIDDRARLHSLYTDFILDCLEGSAMREKMWAELNSGRVGL